MTDERTPVIIGVGQCEQRTTNLETAREPIALLADAVRAAALDSGADVLTRIDAIAVVQIISWRYGDPGARVGELLGIAPRATYASGVGGNSPQLLVNTFADAIARGAHDVVCIGGAEAYASRMGARRAQPKVWLPWEKDTAPDTLNLIGSNDPGTNAYEEAHGAYDPVSVYPLFETAIRHRLGHDVAAHQQALGALYERFAAAAARNPHAWDRTPYSAADITTPGPDNRIIGFPYTKRMCAYANVDQAAAVIMCSLATARALGVADEQMVFVHAGADAHDHWWFSERESLASSPAISAAATDALRAAGIGVDDVARFDLYSCFPSAVELACDALGIAPGDPRPLTVTGGLAFAGGPWNNYPTHAIAAMVQECRRDPGAVGMVSALGWYATKHSIGVYSTQPPADGFRRVDPAVTQATVDATPTRVVATDYAGRATIEATSVLHDRDGAPAHAIVSALTPDGARVLARTADVGIMRSMCTEAWEGRTTTIRAEHGIQSLLS